MVEISHATLDDAEHILALQKLAYQSEALLYNGWSIPPLMQTIESLREEFSSLVILKATIGERIVGSVRAKVTGETCAIGRLIVHPEFQGRGIGSRLLQTIERSCDEAKRFELFTGSKSENSIHLYQRAGYRITKTQPLSPSVTITFLEKTANAALGPRISAIKTIIASDIHGVTAELRSMIEAVIRGATFLSPWDSDTCPFTDEKEAASVFISQNGIESYADKISVAANHEPAYIIGFSVGASAAWLHSTSENCNPDSAATLFYGSRIRNYLSLKPKFAITAVFAETESSFSPREIVSSVARDNVRAFIEPGTSHGFMNPRSVNFSPVLCSAYLQKLAVELEHFRHRLVRQ